MRVHHPRQRHMCGAPVCPAGISGTCPLPAAPVAPLLVCDAALVRGQSMRIPTISCGQLPQWLRTCNPSKARHSRRSAPKQLEKMGTSWPSRTTLLYMARMLRRHGRQCTKDVP